MSFTPSLLTVNDTLHRYSHKITNKEPPPQHTQVILAYNFGSWSSAICIPTDLDVQLLQTQFHCCKDKYCTDFALQTAINNSLVSLNLCHTKEVSHKQCIPQWNLYWKSCANHVYRMPFFFKKTICSLIWASCNTLIILRIVYTEMICTWITCYCKSTV